MTHRDSYDPDELVLAHRALAKRLAWRYARGDPELVEELEQVATVGLVQAAHRFDPQRGTAFSTFAVPTIVGELRRYFRSARWVVHVPRRLQEAYLTARDAAREMASDLGHPPGAAEVADRLGWTLEELLEARAAGGALWSASLDAPASEGDDPGSPLGEHLGEEDPGYEACERRDQVEQALATLDPSAEEAVRLRYADELSFSEVAARIGVSPTQASRIVNGALHELRMTMELQAA